MVRPRDPAVDRALAVDDRDAWTDLVESLRTTVLGSDLGLPVLAALLVAERDHPDLLDLWRTQVVAPRVAMVADRFGWPLADARRHAELALGGLIAAHIAEGSVDATRARELADLLWDRVITEGAGP